MGAVYNPFYKQRLKTDIGNAGVDRGFIAHYVLPATKATAAGAANVLAATALDAEAQVITTGITNPLTARVLSVTGSAAGVTGDVIIEGYDMAGQAITNTITASGASTVVGTRAFASITKITLPIGTAEQTISVGLADALGIPYKLPYDTVLKIYNNNVATTVASGSAFSATVLAGNYIKPTAVPALHQIDVYFIV